MSKEAIQAKIEEIMSEIDAKFAEAGKLADSIGVSIYYEGPAWGMGGHYSPRSVPGVIREYREEEDAERDRLLAGGEPKARSEEDEDWEESEYEEEDEDSIGWQSSSSSC